MKRWFCRIAHGPDMLRHTIAGGSVLACIKCGASFRDAIDARVLHLDSMELSQPGSAQLTLDGHLRAQAMADPPAAWAAVGYRVLKRATSVADDSDISGRRAMGGELLRSVGDAPAPKVARPIPLQMPKERAR